MSNPLNDFYFDEMIRLSKISDDELETEYKVARKLAEKRDMPTDWRYLELVEHEITIRNRKDGGNTTWRLGRYLED